MKVQGLMVLLLAVVLAGCVQQKPYTLGKVFREIPPPPTDKAQFVFYYPAVRGIDIVEPTNMWEITEDDTVVSGVVKHSYALHTTTPGHHEYRIGPPLERWTGINAVSLAAQAGKTCYMRLQMTSALLFVWYSFEAVPEEVALEELETLRQLRFRKDLYAAQ